MYQKFYDAGLHIIPVPKESKGTFTRDYDDWSLHGIPEGKIDEFESRPYENFGLLFGPASGLIGIDLDIYLVNGKPAITDRWLLSLYQACPESNIEWMGQKAGTRVFRWNPEILKLFGKASNRKIFGKYVVTEDLAKAFPHLGDKIGQTIEQGVEIRLQRCFSVIPPSIHPVTKRPYRYLKEDLLEVATYHRQEIPIASLRDIEHLMSFKDTAPKTSERSLSSSGGRNNKFVEMITAARAKGKTDVEIAKEIYKYDFERNTTRLFTDPSSGYAASSEKDAMLNALKMVLSVSMSLLDSDSFFNELDDKVQDVEVLEDIPEFREKPVQLEYPHGTALAHIATEINAINYAVNPNLSLASALELMSTFCSGRYRGQDGVYPVLFSMILADQSAGKGAPMSVCNKVLIQDKDIRDYKLFGSEDFNSDVEPFIDFSWKRFQFCSIDEGSNFLKQSSNGNTLLPGVVQKLLKLWSVGGGYWSLPKALTRKSNNGEGFGPHLNLLIAMQKAKFVSAQTTDLLDSGFLARFLYFLGDDKPKKNNNVYHSDPNLPAVKSYFKLWYDSNPLALPGFDLTEENRDFYKRVDLTPVVVQNPSDIIKLKASINEEYFHKQREDHLSPVQKALYSKAGEQVARVALVHCVSRQDVGILKIKKSFCLDAKDLDWAKYLVDTTIESAHRLISESTRTDASKVVEKIREISKPDICVPLSKLNEKLRGFSSELRVRGIDLAEKEGLIRKEKTRGGIRVTFLG